MNEVNEQNEIILRNAWQKNKTHRQKKTERNGQEIKKPKVKMT